jgi:hypothetical protein
MRNLRMKAAMHLPFFREEVCRILGRRAPLRCSGATFHSVTAGRVAGVTSTINAG